MLLGEQRARKEKQRSAREGVRASVGMDVFEQEETTPEPGDEQPHSLSEELETGLSDRQPDGLGADSGDEPDTPLDTSAVSAVFDVEERTPRKARQKRFVRVPEPVKHSL